jgi:hypothetical protein
MDIDKPNREVDRDLTAMEHRLATWRPSPGALDRDRMLYDAGRAAAMAETRVRAWRLATAALALISIGLGGLLAHERSLLTREQALLALERSQRRSLESAPAAGTGTAERSSPAPTPGDSLPAETLAPTSYFVLTSRLARSAGDLSSLDVEIEPATHRPVTRPSETLPTPGPLRPGDVRRVLDL